MGNFGPNFGDNFDTGYDEAKKIAEEEGKENKIEKILEIVKRLDTKTDQQKQILNKIAVLVSKMFQVGEINNDTFNKLDEFLKPYHDNPYQDGNY